MNKVEFKDATLPKYSELRPFCEGLAAVKNRNNLWGFINKKGEEVIACQFTSVGDFSERLAAVKNKDNLWGYINKKGWPYANLCASNGTFLEPIIPRRLG